MIVIIRQPPGIMKPSANRSKASNQVPRPKGFGRGPAPRASIATMIEPIGVIAIMDQLIFALLGFFHLSMARSMKAETAPSNIPIEEVSAAKSTSR